MSTDKYDPLVEKAILVIKEIHLENKRLKETNHLKNIKQLEDKVKYLTSENIAMVTLVNELQAKLKAFKGMK